MARVQDVAAAVLAELGEPTTTMKLQKLLYYCQGWHLAWDGEPLFDAPIEAWANGPVVREVYERHRGRFVVGPTWQYGDPEELTGSERESVALIVDAYREWTARDLSVKTHQERPWVEARGDLLPGARSSAVILLDTMADYFTGLMADG